MANSGLAKKFNESPRYKTAVKNKFTFNRL
jgi:hypothetical protein